MRNRPGALRRNGILAMVGAAGLAFGLAGVASAQDSGDGSVPTYDYDLGTMWEAYLRVNELSEETTDVETLVLERERFEALYRSGNLMDVIGSALGETPDAAPGPGTSPTGPANPGAGEPVTPRGEITAGGNEGDKFVIGPFSEPVSLSVLINFVSLQTGVPILYTDPEVTRRELVMNLKVEVPAPRVLEFLGQVLDQQGFALIYDADFAQYRVYSKTEVPRVFGTNDLSPVRFISTGPLAASRVKALVDQIGLTSGSDAVVALDEVGLLSARVSSVQARQIEAFIERMTEEYASLQYIEFPVRHIAASLARDRILDQLSPGGGTSRSTPQGGSAAEQARALAAQGTGGSLPNLGERLSVAPQSNVLVFRGKPDEAVLLQGILTFVDVPNRLRAEWYAIGPQAEAVAEAGQREGLGDVSIFAGATSSQGRSNSTPRLPNPNAPVDQSAGPGFTIYPEAGGFIYRGTDEQHERIVQLTERLDGLAKGASPVWEFYKIQHNKAADVAGLIQDMLSSQVAGAASDLLPGGLSRRDNRTNVTDPNANAAAEQAGATGPDVAIQLTEDISITADENNNQIIVKAPQRLQPQFARIIRKLDIRRPQVYLDVKIVTLTTDENFRFAVESQIVAGQFGINTNYGLSGAPADILSPKNVTTTLSGLTASLVKSDYVPFISNTLKSNTDTRVVAEPQILVDDNEEATITSVDEQPTTTTTIGNATSDTSFGGFVEAGPELVVTPRISEGGYVSLDYSVKISSFQGDSPSPGIPSARRTDSVESSVQIPSDSTVIVGGLTFSTKSNTVVKIPLLGDIPLAGLAFRDTRDSESKNILYVFITPRIMRDESFDDLRVVSGPALAEAGYDQDYPAPEPLLIGLTNIPPATAPVVVPAPTPSAVRTEALGDESE